MLRAGRHYGLLFLLFGVPFGLLTRISSSTGGALASGIFFGAFMSLIVGTRNLRSSRGSDGPLRSLWPRQKAELVVAADLPAVGEQVLGALVVLPARITTESPTLFEARTGMTWRSYGEVVRVELEPTEHGTHVRATSRPRMPATLIDYGRGREQVDAVVEALRTAFPVVTDEVGDDLSASGPTDPSQPAD